MTNWTVALRKESVDRNNADAITLAKSSSSLSARRAWIEITVLTMIITICIASLSARRAWIEILGGY